MTMSTTSTSPFRAALLVAAACAVAAGCRCGPATCAPVARPNILLISLDTLRADHLPLYGYHRPTSPNLERLAAEGVVFEQALSQSSSTLPSHRSLFQARPASRLHDAGPVLAELLKRAGYTTAAFTGGGNVAAAFGFGRGFARYDESTPPPGRFVGVFPRFERFLREEATEPFFVFLHGYDIHHPYDPPAPFADAFSPGYQGAITGAATGLFLNKVRRIHQFADYTGPVEVNADDRRRVEDLYDGAILYADTYLGRVDALLAERGLADTTHVIVLSDHGEEFWEHGSVLHSFTVYQEMLHVPLVMRLADRRWAGRRVPDLVRLMDVSPTLLDLADVAQPATMVGHSLLPLVAGGPGPQRAVAEMGRFKAWFDPPFKLILGEEAMSVELYDLVADPGEQRDLAATAVATRSRLAAELAAALGQAIAVEVSGSARTQAADPRVLDQLRALGYIE